MRWAANCVVFGAHIYGDRGYIFEFHIFRTAASALLKLIKLNATWIN